VLQLYFSETTNAARSRASASMKLLFQPEATTSCCRRSCYRSSTPENAQNRGAIKTLQCEYF